MYYQVKYSFSEEGENGKTTKNQESWLFRAESYTEAEAVATKAISELHADMAIKDIKPLKVADVIGTEDDDDCDFFWSTRTRLVQINEVSGKEETVTVSVLVGACEIDTALTKLNKYWDEGVSDYEIVGIAKSNIVEYHGR